MIKPNKYTNLDLSVINISVEIIKLLRQNSASKFDDVLNKVIYKKGKGAKDVFLHSLSFLFLLNKLKYYPKEDILALYETE